jgi:hypothetical protein
LAFVGNAKTQHGVVAQMKRIRFMGSILPPQLLILAP